VRVALFLTRFGDVSSFMSSKVWIFLVWKVSLKAKAGNDSITDIGYISDSSSSVFVFQTMEANPHLSERPTDSSKYSRKLPVLFKGISFCFSQRISGSKHFNQKILK
jgi:hypothetical protein